MRRAVRTSLAFLLFAALFLGGAGLAVATLAQAGPAGEGGVAPPDEESDREAEERNDDENFAPRGPDELFEPLPGNGLHEGTVPRETAKAVILRVPNEGSYGLRPEDDLERDARTSVGGFVLMLEQRLDYLPQVHLEVNRARIHRYAARLRVGDAPRAGSLPADGDSSQALARAARTFGADIVFAVSAVPGPDDAPDMAGCVRYHVEDGVQAAVEWKIAPLGKPEADSHTRVLEDRVEDVTRGILAEKDDNGELKEFPHAEVPRLATGDRALAEFVNLRDNLESGALTSALIAYEDLMKADPRCGRAALYGMEVCRGIAERQSSPEEHATWINRSIKIGVEALEHAPNDVMLRGRLCWNGATHFNRRAWAREGLNQAMVVQPANVSLFDWWVLAYAYDDKLKQAEWMIENALPKVSDGRIELSLGNIYYGAGDYAAGVEWYTRATEAMPFEHEAFLSLGLCGNYEAERQVNDNDEVAAREAYARASDALWRAIEIDPLEVGWTYEYYVRTKTRKFTYLPTNPDELLRLFLVQAAVNGLSRSSRSFQWEELTQDVNHIMQRRTRKAAREAGPDDEMYALKLIARFKLAVVDNDQDDMIHTLWLMREDGWHPELYDEAMARLGPLVEAYEPPAGD